MVLCVVINHFSSFTNHLHCETLCQFKSLSIVLSLSLRRHRVEVYLPQIRSLQQARFWRPPKFNLVNQ